MKRTITVEAIYENGVLRPLTPLGLGEGEVITIALEASGGGVQDATLEKIWRKMRDEMTDARLSGAVLEGREECPARR